MAWVLEYLFLKVFPSLPAKLRSVPFENGFDSSFSIREGFDFFLGFGVNDCRLPADY